MILKQRSIPSNKFGVGLGCRDPLSVLLSSPQEDRNNPQIKLFEKEATTASTNTLLLTTYKGQNAPSHHCVSQQIHVV